MTRVELESKLRAILAAAEKCAHWEVWFEQEEALINLVAFIESELGVELKETGE